MRRRVRLDLGWLARLAETKGELPADSALPPGPFLVALTDRLPLYRVLCADGRAVCGNIPSFRDASTIALALTQWEALERAGMRLNRPGTDSATPSPAD